MERSRIDIPYLPSNGTEGEWFMSEWCEKCQKDTIGRGGSIQCGILTKALLNKQPKQWVTNHHDGDRCLSFKAISDRKKYAKKQPKEQTKLLLN